ncbi:MAG: glycosyltransferase family 1 protein [Bacteroidota bacterium]
MRIAINTRFLLKDKLEGVGWFTYEIAKRLVKNHPQDTFFFLFDRPYEADFVFAANVHPLVLSPPARHPVLFYIWFEYAVARALKRHKIDLFLSPDNFCSLRTKVPTVLVVHDLAYAHFPDQLRKRDLWYYRYFMPKFIQQAAQIVTVSNYTKSDILERHPIATSKISVACNGCRPSFKPVSLAVRESIRAEYSEGKEYFFYVGAVHPRKNVHRLIAAFDQFKQQTKSDTQLLIAGRFSWQTGAVKTAYDLAKYQAAIHFLGYVSDDLLPQLMGSALAITYISTFEGFGVPLLEAMHCEVPIITANVSSMPEVAGEAALLVDPFQVDAIAAAMCTLQADKQIRENLVARAKSQRKLFSWESAAQVVYEACEKVCV